MYDDAMAHMKLNPNFSLFLFLSFIQLEKVFFLSFDFLFKLECIHTNEQKKIHLRRKNDIRSNFHSHIVHKLHISILSHFTFSFELFILLFFSTRARATRAFFLINRRRKTEKNMRSLQNPCIIFHLVYISMTYHF